MVGEGEDWLSLPQGVVPSSKCQQYVFSRQGLSLHPASIIWGSSNYQIVISPDYISDFKGGSLGVLAVKMF